jgi:hypothetical protein
MKPEDINLSSPSRMFEYEKLSREIDTIDDLKTIKTMFKAYLKLYLKQKETVESIALMKPDD